MLHFAQPWRGDDRPVMVLLHGALRTSRELAHWSELLHEACDVVLADLPGHGRSVPTSPGTLEQRSSRILSAIRTGIPERNIFLLGESLGGLFSLAIAGASDPSPVRGVIAADPPLSTAKLLNVHASFQRVIQKSAPDAPIHDLAYEIFGIKADGVEGRNHYPVLDRLLVPTMILTGDLELFPLRHTPEIPVLLDGMDRYFLEKFYAPKVEVRHVADSDHLMLAKRAEACLPLVLDFVRRHRN